MSSSHAQGFLRSARPHVLMVTNHGIHGWDVLPGLPDTGGQNVFVNQLSATLLRLGYRVTTANRGGYPHPRTGEPRRGITYRNPHERILYVEDGLERFVRKEDMHDRLDALGDNLAKSLADEGTGVDLIISHYWDGAAVAARFREALGLDVRHLCIPHSLGAIKRHNMPRERWAELRIEERIAAERRVVGLVDGVASTSRAVAGALRQAYGVKRSLFLPPCVDSERYGPRVVGRDDPLWEAMVQGSTATSRACRMRPLIVEVSRTDRTKRKDLLLRAFARVRRSCPEAFLALTIDREAQPLADELIALVEELGLAGHVAILGSVWELLPSLYGAAAIYCTPSEMEGFGMAIQEAAACGVPAVASDRVPFAVEYLARARGEGGVPGAIVVRAGDEEGFAVALTRLIADPELRRAMGEAARAITIPDFTWDGRTASFLAEAGVR